EIYRNADFFASSSSNAKEFRENAEKENYRVINVNNLSPNARNLNNLSGAREVVRWAFTDASVGDVSEIFELDNAYVVALVTGQTEDGYAKLDAVREQVALQVRNDKKAKYIADKIAGLGSLRSEEHTSELQSRE